MPSMALHLGHYLVARGPSRHAVCGPAIRQGKGGCGWQRLGDGGIPSRCLGSMPGIGGCTTPQACRDLMSHVWRILRLVPWDRSSSRAGRWVAPDLHWPDCVSAHAQGRTCGACSMPRAVDVTGMQVELLSILINNKGSLSTVQVPMFRAKGQTWVSRAARGTNSGLLICDISIGQGTSMIVVPPTRS